MRTGVSRGGKRRAWNPCRLSFPNELPVVVCVALVVLYVVLLHWTFSSIEYHIRQKHALEMSRRSTNASHSNSTSIGDPGDPVTLAFPGTVDLFKISGMDMVREGVAHLERVTIGLHAVFPAFSDTSSSSEFAMQLDILALELVKGDTSHSTIMKRAEDLWMQYDAGALSPRRRQIQMEHEQRASTSAESTGQRQGRRSCRETLRQYASDLGVLESILGFRSLLIPRATAAEVEAWRQRELPWLSAVQLALSDCHRDRWASPAEEHGESLPGQRSLSELGEVLALLDLLRGKDTTGEIESRWHDTIVDPLLHRHLRGAADDSSAASPSCPAVSVGMLGANLLLPSLDDAESTLYGRFDEGTVLFLEYILHEWVRCVTGTGASGKTAASRTGDGGCDTLGDAYERVVEGMVGHVIRTFSSRGSNADTEMNRRRDMHSNPHHSSSTGHNSDQDSVSAPVSRQPSLLRKLRQESRLSLLQHNATVLGMLFDPHYQEHDEARWLPLVHRSSCAVPAVLGLGVHTGVHRRRHHPSDVTLSEADVLVAAESLMSTCVRLHAVRPDLPEVVGIGTAAGAGSSMANTTNEPHSLTFIIGSGHHPTAKESLADIQAFRTTLLRGCYVLYLATEDDLYGHMAREVLSAPPRDDDGVTLDTAARSTKEVGVAPAIVLSAVTPTDASAIPGVSPQSDVETYMKDYMAQQRYFGHLVMSMECVVYKRKNRGLCPLLRRSILTSHGDRVMTLDESFPF